MSDFSLLIQLYFLQYALDFQIISASSSFSFQFFKETSPVHECEEKNDKHTFSRNTCFLSNNRDKQRPQKYFRNC